MEQARVLIVSDDAEFVNSIVQSWHRWACTPEFTVSSIHGSAELSASAVVVVDGALVVDGQDALSQLFHLTGEVSLVIAITVNESFPKACATVRRVVQIRRHSGWADFVAALTHEAILNADAQHRVTEVEHRLRESERFAALGHFIAEARHGLANALTSVLGNSELVLMETESGLRDEVRGQLETIHAMSLKIHGTLQRLSSLDREMQMAERQAERETLLEPANVAGPH